MRFVWFSELGARRVNPLVGQTPKATHYGVNPSNEFAFSFVLNLYTVLRYPFQCSDTCFHDQKTTISSDLSHLSPSQTSGLRMLVTIASIIRYVFVSFSSWCLLAIASRRKPKDVDLPLLALPEASPLDSQISQIMPPVSPLDLKCRKTKRIPPRTRRYQHWPHQRLPV